MLNWFCANELWITHCLTSIRRKKTTCLILKDNVCLKRNWKQSVMLNGRKWKKEKNKKNKIFEKHTETMFYYKLFLICLILSFCIAKKSKSSSSSSFSSDTNPVLTFNLLDKTAVNDLIEGYKSWHQSSLDGLMFGEAGFFLLLFSI